MVDFTDIKDFLLSAQRLGVIELLVTGDGFYEEIEKYIQQEYPMTCVITGQVFGVEPEYKCHYKIGELNLYVKK